MNRRPQSSFRNDRNRLYPAITIPFEMENVQTFKWAQMLINGRSRPELDLNFIKRKKNHCEAAEASENGGKWRQTEPDENE